MKKNYISILFLLLIGSLLWYDFINEPPDDDNKYALYLRKLNLELSGKIIDKKYVDHGIYEIIVDMSQSNISLYRPQDSLNHYLCRIENDKAEVFLSDPSNYYEKGDSLILSSKQDSCYSFNDKKILKHKRKLEVIDFVKYPPSGTSVR